VPAALELRGLAVSYGPSVALDSVDLVVPQGCVVGILGPNGAGKSTLMKAIAGLVRPVTGAIFHNGERIDDLRPSAIARRGIRLIPEGRGILPGLTVGENLDVMISRDEAALERVYERFPVLAERSEQSAGTLSGGEQQMLALAGAQRDGTSTLLVDEPSLGLAPRLVAKVSEELRHLHEVRGQTIVWVEQYAARVLALADIVYILGRGRVVWAGEPAELEASPVLVRSYLGGAQV
jgi:branched-chain amino acid transport system ATP-binding protein